MLSSQVIRFSFRSCLCSLLPANAVALRLDAVVPGHQVLLQVVPLLATSSQRRRIASLCDRPTSSSSPSARPSALPFQPTPSHCVLMLSSQVIRFSFRSCLCSLLPANAVALRLYAIGPRHQVPLLPVPPLSPSSQRRRIAS